MADVERGTIKFGDDFEFPMQVLGTEAEQPGTWLWAWANEESDIPPALLKCAESLKVLGAKENIPELYTPELSLEQVEGHLLAMVAVGVCRASAYYRGPYPGGAAFVLIDTPQVKLADPPDLVRIVNTFVQFVSFAPMDHKQAFKAYTEERGFHVEQTADGLLARSPGGDAITAEFDKHGRLVNLSTMVKP